MTSPSSAAPRASARAILTSLGEAVYAWDVASDALTWSANAPEVLGVPGFEAIATGTRFSALVEAAEGADRASVVRSSADTDSGAGIAYRTTYALRPAGPEGPVLHVEDVGRWFPDERGRPLRAQGVVRVGADRQGDAVPAGDAGRIDPLTGQLTRARLLDALGEALKAVAVSGKPAAFMLASIDGLGAVNESFGMAAGDAAIAEAARRIKAQLRAGDVVGRYSGNLLGVLVMNCSERAMAAAGERFAAGVRGGVVESERMPFAFSVTIGGIALPRQAKTTEEAMLGAERALGLARRDSPGGFQALPATLESRGGAGHLRVAEAMLGGLNARRLVLVAEPAEVPGRPERFGRASVVLPVEGGDRLEPRDYAEAVRRAGLAAMVDHRGLELAAAALGWDGELSICLRVTPAAVLDPRWSKAAAATFLRGDGRASRLTVEIGCETFAAHTDAVLRFGEGLGRIGCRVALTGFGDGPVPLGALGRLAPDLVLVADGPVERALGAGPEGAASNELAALVMLARSHGAEVGYGPVSDAGDVDPLRGLGIGWLHGPAIGSEIDLTPADDAAAAV